MVANLCSLSHDNSEYISILNSESDSIARWSRGQHLPFRGTGELWTFSCRGWSQVSCQRCLVKSDAYKLLKEAPLWQSHLWRDDWVAQWSELFPSQLPALQLLPVDSIHFRKWIACGAFPKSWVSAFVVGSHSYFLIEAFFLSVFILLMLHPGP